MGYVRDRCDQDEELEDVDREYLEEVYPLRPSLFPNIPPYVKFIPVKGNTKFKVEPPDEMREMLWQVPTAVYYTIMDCAGLNGFTVSETRIRQFEGTMRSGAVWDSLPITEKNNDSIEFEALPETVKINQFPAMQQLGRKDNLAQNMKEMAKKFGKKHFKFMPKTYLLPKQKKSLKKVMDSNPDKFWIAKPPNLYCGMGIKVVNKFQDIPGKKGCQCVQSYIKNPLLINNLKFDLRIYVLITSVDPLRIYLYEEGLTRFATEEYSNDVESISNNFIHLTNFSVNRESENFVQNSDPEEPEGSKWTLTSLWKYFETVGIEKGPIWKSVQDIVIKSILSAQSHLVQGFQANCSSHYSCYKILGYDILLDSSLQAHLIEINTIPSLAAQPDTIDAYVKNPMVAEMFNIAGFHVPQEVALKHQNSIIEKLNWNHPGLLPLGHDKRLYCKRLNREDCDKEIYYKDINNREKYLDTICEDLGPHDVRLLARMEDEISQTKMFHKIWPSSSCYEYFPFLDEVSYKEKLMDAWEFYYEDQREEGIEYLAEYCQEKVHLRVPKQQMRPLSPSSISNNSVNSNTKLTAKRSQLKMVIKKDNKGFIL